MAKMWYRTVVVALAAAAAAASTTPASTTTTTTPTPTVYNATAASATGIAAHYAYVGCYLEISGLNGTVGGGRSLDGDGASTDEVLPGDMTVPKCLAFCGGGGSGSAYRYAGLEYARECWCGQALAARATLQPAADCRLPCDGDATTLCGGDLRISLYMLSSSPGRVRPGAVAVVVAALLVLKYL